LPAAARRVLIVGGGISGLSAAYDLTRAGADCTVFEKRPRLGGVIETLAWEDCLLECGPDSFLSAKPEAAALIKELGLESEMIGSNDHQRTTYILKKGRLVRLPEGVMMIVPTRVMPMVRSPLLGWGTKLGMALELLRRKPGANQAGRDRSVAEFVLDHFGQETLDYLAEPLLSGVYGGDPRQLGMAGVLPRFLQMEANYGSLGRAVMKSKGQGSSGGSLFRTLRGGLGTLVDRVSKGLQVKHDAVEAIEKQGSGFRVRTGGAWLEADQVILACPAWAASALLSAVDADLAGLLEAIPYSSSLTLSLIYKASEFDGMRAGFGFLVPQKERERVAAATFVATKFPHRAPQDRIILRCFFGGTGDEAVLQESDDSLLAIARRELKRILGLTAAPVFHSISRWPRSMAQYNVGHLGRIQQIKARAAAIPGLHLAGNAYEGIGIPDCIRTGRAAAKQILTGSV
jgi:protoporphyrinogen/coproporphyrinogen III oxidase